MTTKRSSKSADRAAVLRDEIKAFKLEIDNLQAHMKDAREELFGLVEAGTVVDGVVLIRPQSQSYDLEVIRAALSAKQWRNCVTETFDPAKFESEVKAGNIPISIAQASAVTSERTPYVKVS